MLQQTLMQKHDDAQSELSRKSFHVTPRRICWFLFTIVAVLLVVNLVIIYFRFVVGNEHLRGFVHGFYFDHEANFPSAYSAAAILFSAVILWKISSLPDEKKARRANYWKFLAVVFLFIAADEFLSLHEYLIVPVRSRLENTAFDSGYLYFGWLVPYLAITLVLAVLLIRFLLKLPARPRNRLLLAAVLFMGGAVGMEMIGGNYWAHAGWAIDGSDEVDLTYALIITAEELLEMLGVIVFIYALLDYYLSRRSPLAVHIQIGNRV